MLIQQGNHQSSQEIGSNISVSYHQFPKFTLAYICYKGFSIDDPTLDPDHPFHQSHQANIYYL